MARKFLKILKIRSRLRQEISCEALEIICNGGEKSSLWHLSSLLGKGGEDLPILWTELRALT